MVRLDGFNFIKFNVMKKVISLSILALLTGCGGGGDSTVKDTPVATTLPASSTVENLCQNPRTGTDPFNDNKPFPDKQGTLANEKTWLRSWIDETYLWYKEVPTTLKPEDYSTAIDYFDVLKTSAKTASGNAKDRFHFTYPTAAWDAMSQQGVELGYGITWSRVATNTLPRKLVIAMVEPGSPAATAGLLRGDQLFSVDNADFLNGNDQATIDAINNGLSPEKEGEVHNLVVTRNNANIAVSLAATNVVAIPVQNTKTIDTPSGKVGYLTFNDHNAVSESKLIDSITQLKAAGINDLVLDLRYNGGGYLDIASELAYMIAGPEQTNGKIFEQTQFNGKWMANETTLFHSKVYGFSAPKGQPLPYLGLKKITVLTSAGTCSASEAIINSLQGVDVEVNLIGGQTCGKPYGFYATPNCGTTYFAIQFKGVNNKGYGDYADGIPATCNVADDFTHALGDPAEGQLAAALSYRNTKTCPAASSGVQLQTGLHPQKVQLLRPLAKEMAIYKKFK